VVVLALAWVRKDDDDASNVRTTVPHGLEGVHGEKLVEQQDEMQGRGALRIVHSRGDTARSPSPPSSGWPNCHRRALPAAHNALRTAVKLSLCVAAPSNNLPPELVMRIPR
jgi:hypothetical protein